MDIKEFETILKVGEHIAVEFKAAKGGSKNPIVARFFKQMGRADEL